MAFLSLSIEQSYLTTEKTQLEFEVMCMQNQLDSVTEELTSYLDDDNADAEDAYAQKLENLQEYYDEKKENIESRLKLLNEEISAYDKIVGENIKNSCKLSYQG